MAPRTNLLINAFPFSFYVTTNKKHAHPVVNSQILDNLSSSECRFLTDKATSHFKYLSQCFKMVADFFSFSQFKVERISFPKSTIFSFVAKVNFKKTCSCWWSISLISTRSVHVNVVPIDCACGRIGKSTNFFFVAKYTNSKWSND